MRAAIDNHRGTAVLEDEGRWRAVMERDAGSDGAFVYAVLSTGIYCRPSCPSKRPNRQQVRFFGVPEAAEQAGFRACLRCLPRETDADAREPLMEGVQRACRYIEDNLDGEAPLTLTALSEHVHISPHHLQRTFKRIMGITPRQYAEACRLERLKARLKEGDNVTTALYDAGYGSSSRLYERAPGQLGMTPAAYRKGGTEARISYTIVDCYLGRLLVAATDKGICSITLGMADGSLEANLRVEYPAANINRDEAGLGEWVSAILSYLEGQQPHLDLPLDVKATAFQWRVWQELRAIPYGSTRSYGQVAQALGNPKATRAVARACATNPVALAIPCHRVVREDGSLGGYRWGVERKEALLAQEQRVEQEHAG